MAWYSVCGRPTAWPFRISRETRPASSSRRRCGRTVLGWSARRRDSSRTDTGRPDNPRYRYSRYRVSSARALWISTEPGSDILRSRYICEASTVPIRIIIQPKQGGVPVAVTEEQGRQALRQVLDPEIGKPIEDLGMLKGVEVDGGNVRVFVLLTIAGCPLRDRIDRDVRAAVGPLDGVTNIDVVLGEMSSEQRENLVTDLRGGASAN